MEEGFKKHTDLELSYVHWDVWTSLGIRHGFTDRSVDITPRGWKDCHEKLASAFDVRSLIINNQQHSTEVADFRDAEGLLREITFPSTGKLAVIADAIVCSLEKILDNGTLCYGIMTADCIPLLVRCGEQFGIIHAGWRGLAGGIIEKTLDLLGARHTECEIIIGPCAGPEKYEVGPEVMAAIGDTARGVSLANGKCVLDLVASARQRIEKYSPSISVHAANICTISNREYHSYRRDGDSAGRILTFLVSRA